MSTDFLPHQTVKRLSANHIVAQTQDRRPPSAQDVMKEILCAVTDRIALHIPSEVLAAAIDAAGAGQEVVVTLTIAVEKP